jgi:hypothetical protein
VKLQEAQGTWMIYGSGQLSRSVNHLHLSIGKVHLGITNLIKVNGVGFPLITATGEFERRKERAGIYFRV